MSYDLDLFYPQPQIEPIVTIQQIALLRDSAQTPLNHQVARHLELDNSKFHIKVAPDVIQVMDEIEGIRITLYAHSAQVSIPFWFTDHTVIALAFRTARQYIRIIISHTAYSVYDPQLGRIVDMDDDLLLMIAAYTQAINGMQSIS